MAARRPPWLRSVADVPRWDRARSSSWAQGAEAQIARGPVTPTRLRRYLRDLDTIARAYERRGGDPIVLRDLDRARVALEDRLARYGHLSESHGEFMAARRGRSAGAGRVAAPAGGPRRETSRNTYPPWKRPGPEDQAALDILAERLRRQTGLPIRTDQILEAGWTGDVRRKPGRPQSKNWSALGFRRARGTWSTAFRRDVPEATLLRGGNVVTPEYARAMGWPDDTIGQPLEHHHIEHGGMVVPLPKNYHPAHGRLHGTTTTMATPADSVAPPLF